MEYRLRRGALASKRDWVDWLKAAGHGIRSQDNPDGWAILRGQEQGWTYQHGMQAASWDEPMHGDPGAANVVLRIITAKARLHGLYDLRAAEPYTPRIVAPCVLRGESGARFGFR